MHRARFIKPPRNYWFEIRKELYLLLCTKDNKYKTLRSQLKKNSSTTSATILSMISVTVTAQLGAAIGITTPLVALFLYSVLKIGVNGYCNILRKEIDVGD